MTELRPLCRFVLHLRCSASAVDTAHQLLALFDDDAARVRTVGRAAASALRVFDALRDRPSPP